ncbi:hypothetical protein [Limosilactobacillus fastidiosus]|uniref:Uncharacterized protein n=1 Tax=Limosilactobacillus fastidiosus TaxID=2759855 RepID=A0A7W3TY76_9LACO|nr:hypothetical protein [Limosilactobacillus fastidiosus]MBB1063182.1 hypothetical protein [Limosilactobacillus fastidiosus]MBB1085402.1 hypothetical protein [Limosilactobacillus fastidiosus]MCD7083704.1 hypothetical protein [Limosilactobacillus fastidiosus]MCD7085384.1 hypothetical protein [Limosilactobacillus fastidiosus]MCD7114851.1 hypothetical protein [Limosilactobacillus fastidiosus]
MDNQKRLFNVLQKMQDDCSDCSSIQAVCLAYAMIKSVGIMNNIPTGSLLKFCEKNVEVKRSNNGVIISVPEDLASDGN